MRIPAFLIVVFTVCPAFAGDAPPAVLGDIVGELVEIPAAWEDTFVGLGQTHGVGYDELVAANPGVDPWLPGTGTAIVLPKRFVLPDAPREGVVINLAEMRLYLFESGEEEAAGVESWPISIGQLLEGTPTGATTIIEKLRNPTWYPPESVIARHASDGRRLPRIVPPGPDNPLGKLALQLGFSGYLIHGTNRPAGIGMRITAGCIRMLPGDIETLSRRTERGTPVHIVDQPYKFGWEGERLYLEVHRAFDGDDPQVDEGMTTVVERFVAATKARKVNANWQAIEDAYRRASGLPVHVADALPIEAASGATSGSGHGAD